MTRRARGAAASKLWAFFFSSILTPEFFFFLGVAFLDYNFRLPIGEVRGTSRIISLKDDISNFVLDSHTLFGLFQTNGTGAFFIIYLAAVSSLS